MEQDNRKIRTDSSIPSEVRPDIFYKADIVVIGAGEYNYI
jgi:hypothetical protein